MRAAYVLSRFRDPDGEIKQSARMTDRNPGVGALFRFRTGGAAWQFVRLDDRHRAGLIRLDHRAGRPGRRRLDDAVVLLELVAERLILRRRIGARADALRRRLSRG